MWRVARSEGPAGQRLGGIPLRPGSIIRAHIEEASGSEVVLRTGSARLRAKTDLSLPAGEVRLFRVLSMSPRLVLRVLPTDVDILAELGLPKGQGESAALKQALRFSLPVTRDSLRSIASAATEPGMAGMAYILAEGKSWLRPLRGVVGDILTNRRGLEGALKLTADQVDLTQAQGDLLGLAGRVLQEWRDGQPWAVRLGPYVLALLAMQERFRVLFSFEGRRPFTALLERKDSTPKVVVLTIDSPSLGRIQAMVSSEGQSVDVSFVAYHRETDRLLRLRSQDLTRLLEEQGLLLRRLLFSEQTTYAMQGLDVRI